MFGSLGLRRFSGRRALPRGHAPERTQALHLLEPPAELLATGLLHRLRLLYVPAQGSGQRSGVFLGDQLRQEQEPLRTMTSARRLPGASLGEQDQAAPAWAMSWRGNGSVCIWRPQAFSYPPTPPGKDLWKGKSSPYRKCSPVRVHRLPPSQRHWGGAWDRDEDEEREVASGFRFHGCGASTRGPPQVRLSLHPACASLPTDCPPGPTEPDT